MLIKKSPFANGNKENKSALAYSLEWSSLGFVVCDIFAGMFICIRDDERSQIADGVVFGCSTDFDIECENGQKKWATHSLTMDDRKRARAYNKGIQSKK